MSKQEHLPPAWHKVEAHGIFPKHDQDDAARFNFVANMNRYLSQTLGEGNVLAYETRVKPQLIEALNREPESRHEIRAGMNNDPFHSVWSAMKRNTMEQRQQMSRRMVLPQARELAEKAAQLVDGKDMLELDPTLEIPPYVASVDHHCMPGSYYTELFDGDVSAGANYDSGMFATTNGGLGTLNDAAGRGLAQWMQLEQPNFKPKRVLDIGCTIGQSTLGFAMKFPDAEIIAIDVAAPVLRYAAARAAALGVTNVKFIQASGEDLSRFEDDSFDMVYTSMFLHETSNASMPKIMKEVYRVLAPGGMTIHLEQPNYTDAMPLYEQFIRDWDSYNNNEPFWTTIHSIDVPGVMVDAGFSRDQLFGAGIAAQEIKPGKEDHGRAAAWHGYGAWKEVA